MFKVSEAKNLRLSKIPPDELEGLEKTFNIYLNLPKSLWPVIRLAESKENWTNILKPLKDFSIELISDQIEMQALENDSFEINSRNIPKRLYEVYQSSTGKNKSIILNSINKYLTDSIAVNKPIKGSVVSAIIQ